MTQTDYYLAEMNIVRRLFPLDHPSMADLVNNINRINTLGDRSPGFIWRLQSEDGDATSFRIFDDDFLLVNLSVWTGIEPLYQYTYSSEHVEFFRRRREWFSKLDAPSVALWWIRAGELPTLQDGCEHLERLWRDGPTPQAFTFKQPYTVEAMLTDRTNAGGADR